MHNSESGFKINTKEILHVITPHGPILSANMSGDFISALASYLNRPIRNLVINFIHITSVDKDFGMELVKIQRSFYQNGASMVFCGFSKQVETFLNKEGLLKKMNHTPTESEACDIVQMDEIERELL